MRPNQRMLMLVVALCGLLVGSVAPRVAPMATLAWQHDGEMAAFARFEADVPLASGCALWANGTSDDALTLGGASQFVGGCIHSNGGARLAGSGHVVEGTLRHARALEIAGDGHLLANGNVTVAPAPYPYAFDARDYAPGGRAAQAASAEQRYFVHVGDVRLAPPLLQEGLHYVEGRATISARHFEGNVTVVATGTLVLRGAAAMRPFIDSLLLHSSSAAQPAIDILASDARLEGALVALDGGISLKGHGTRLQGQLAAERVTVDGRDHELLPRTPRGVAPAPAGANSAEDPATPGEDGAALTTTASPAPPADGGAPPLADGVEELRDALQQAPLTLSYGDFDQDGRGELAVGLVLAEGTLLVVTDPERPLLLIP